MKRNRKLALGCTTVCAEQGNVGRKEREKLRKKKIKGMCMNDHGLQKLLQGVNYFIK